MLHIPPVKPKSRDVDENRPLTIVKSHDFMLIFQLLGLLKSTSLRLDGGMCAIVAAIGFSRFSTFFDVPPGR